MYGVGVPTSIGIIFKIMLQHFTDRYPCDDVETHRLTKRTTINLRLIQVEKSEYLIFVCVDTDSI